MRQFVESSITASGVSCAVRLPDGGCTWEARGTRQERAAALQAEVAALTLKLQAAEAAPATPAGSNVGGDGSAGESEGANDLAAQLADAREVRARLEADLEMSKRKFMAVRLTPLVLFPTVAFPRRSPTAK